MASEQIQILEDLRNPGLSTLEAAAIGAGRYVVTTEALGGTAIEGLIVGGATFVVVQGRSRLLGWSGGTHAPGSRSTRFATPWRAWPRAAGFLRK